MKKINFFLKAAILLIFIKSVILSNDGSEEDEKKEKLIIPIAYGISSDEIIPALVSITSVCYHTEIGTFNDITVLVNKNFTTEEENKLYSIKEIYPEQCNITVKRITADLLGKYNETHEILNPKYYKLLLPTACPNYQIIISLSIDTIVRKGLKDLIKSDMKDKYILGHIGDARQYDLIKNFELVAEINVNTGVLLMDLDKLREFDFQNKALEMLIRKAETLNNNDQTLINVILINKIGILNPIYGIPAKVLNVNKIIDILKEHKKKDKDFYSLYEYTRAYGDPAIIHYSERKPWIDGFGFLHGNVWWFYARKIKFYKTFLYKKFPKMEELEKYQKDHEF